MNSEYPNPDDFLVKTSDTETNILYKNEQGDYIKIASFSVSKFEPELDDQKQPRMRFEVHFDARQPIKLNVVQFLPADVLRKFLDQLDLLKNDSSDS
jgi:hypothetical protein